MGQVKQSKKNGGLKINNCFMILTLISPTSSHLVSFVLICNKFYCNLVLYIRRSLHRTNRTLLLPISAFRVINISTST